MADGDTVLSYWLTACLSEKDMLRNLFGDKKWFGFWSATCLQCDTFLLLFFQSPEISSSVKHFSTKKRILQTLHEVTRDNVLAEVGVKHTCCSGCSGSPSKYWASVSAFVKSLLVSFVLTNKTRFILPFLSSLRMRNLAFGTFPILILKITADQMMH